MLSTGVTLILGGSGVSTAEVWAGMSLFIDGYSCSSSSKTCAICAAGSFCKGGVSNPCPPGKYSVEGAASCDYTGSSGPAGTDASSTSSCAACLAGFYSSTAGATSSSACSPRTPCLSGTFALHFEIEAIADTASCLPCWAGYYSATVGATSSSTCIVCPSNSYSTSTGSSVCTSCPSGTITTGTGATAFSSCLIPDMVSWTKYGTTPWEGESLACLFIYLLFFDFSLTSSVRVRLYGFVILHL